MNDHRLFSLVHATSTDQAGWYIVVNYNPCVRAIAGPRQFVVPPNAGRLKEKRVGYVSMITDPYQPAEIPGSLALIMATLQASESDRLQETFLFAAAAHRDQYRDEGSPFIEHPVRVAQVLWQELGCRNIDMLLSALTHDVLDNCPWISRDVLASLIGESATSIVEDLTKPSVPEAKEAERDREYLDRLPRLPFESRLVKLADRIDNLRSIPNAARPEKAQRYLEVSRAEFIPLALATDQVAARLIIEACDGIERYLSER